MTIENTNQGKQCGDCEQWSGGNYCSNCGQKLDLSHSIGGFILEALPSMMSGDSRFYRTLKMLWFNPGKLTRRYHAGKRTRYLSPIAMLFTAVFLLFTLPLLVGLVPTDDSAARQVEIEQRESIRKFDAEIDDRISTIQNAKGENRVLLIEDFHFDFVARNINARLVDEHIIRRERFAKILDELRTADQNWIENRFNLITSEWARNPILKFSSLRGTLIKFSWFLIPLTLPLLMLFLPGGYTDRFKHALFAGYSLAFMLTLNAILISLEVVGVTSPYALIIAVGIGLAHLFAQTKHTYRLSWLAACTTYIMVLVSIIIALMLFIAVLFVLNLL